MGIFSRKTSFLLCVLSASMLTYACGQTSQKRKPSTSEASKEDLNFFNIQPVLDAAKNKKMLEEAQARAASLPAPNVRVEGSLLMVDNKPYTIKGVCYSPRRQGMRPGMANSLIYQDPSLADRDRIWGDILLMEEAGINTIRVYEPILDAHVLEMFHVKGIKIIQNVIINAETARLCESCSIPKLDPRGWWYNDTASPTADAVKALAKHPTTLMFEVGNEWTLNFFYQSHEFKHDNPWHMGNAADFMGQASEFVKKLAPKVPITSSVSGLLYNVDDKPGFLNGFKYVDVWGINTYDTFDFLNQGLYAWAGMTTKPFYLSEFGADRWHAFENREKEEIAAQAAGAYIDIIRNHLELTHPGTRGIGGTIFTFQDELWQVGLPTVQEKPAVPGQGTQIYGIHGDGIFNEEYFGLISNNRGKKFSAFEVVKGKYRYEMP